MTISVVGQIIGQGWCCSYGCQCTVRDCQFARFWLFNKCTERHQVRQSIACKSSFAHKALAMQRIEEFLPELSCRSANDWSGLRGESSYCLSYLRVLFTNAGRTEIWPVRHAQSPILAYGKDNFEALPEFALGCSSG